ncbi:hypothetical protein [Agromyces larvae]|uniref:Uncharacterized protein n=1 Tax=Agromyces larvae TaxID=2929802 RepID=A0ABY4C3J7_9MICO|nr:hypothetical protein [Agromyces larvae]UOE45889.1 hypothetical protein MTO99_09160 [Agromyces larvae]
MDFFIAALFLGPIAFVVTFLYLLLRGRKPEEIEADAQRRAMARARRELAVEKAKQQLANPPQE